MTSGHQDSRQVKFTCDREVKVLKLGETIMIHQLKKDGLSITAIAERTGLDRKTVRKYLASALDTPVYGPRPPRPTCLDQFKSFIVHRLEQHPRLRATRLLREIRELGYTGGYSTVKRFVHGVRRSASPGWEHRFETPAGRQAQVDFARFVVRFRADPDREQIVWLFSMVLGCSRYLFCRFVLRQDLPAVIRCHIEAFAVLGGVPQEILYDRMKTAVIGEDDEGQIIYNSHLAKLAHHYGFVPRACAAYRAKTKGKVERPFSYIRDDFFLGEQFEDLADMNDKLDRWLLTVANVRCHGTTRRIVEEAFLDEQPSLGSLPAVPYQAVLRAERRVTRDGMVCVDGNMYSIPDSTHRRLVDVQVTCDQVQILDRGALVAIHPVLPGRGQRRIAEGHRRYPPPGNAKVERASDREQVLSVPCAPVARRDLQVYEEIARRLAGDCGVRS
jgi:transposase